jgi:hypothetical protein
MRYRIKPNYIGHWTCQYKRWWWPFWISFNNPYTNLTYINTEEEARKGCELHKTRKPIYID